MKKLQASCCVFAAACLSVLAPLAGAQDAVEGELWDTTAQPSIPGMPVKMPAYKTKICQKKEWSKPPATSKDESRNCKATGFTQTPTKVTWTMACDNPPMTGEGELTFNGTDAYVGVFNMHSDQFDMKIDLTGKKIGTCDDPE